MSPSLKLHELVDGKTRKISFSPAVWRAEFAHNHKKASYESVPLTFVEIPAAILAACQGLLDSFTIAEYLEEKYPNRPSLFGQSPSEKKLHRFFESYTSRENSSGQPHQEIASNPTKNLKELKENLRLIHSALRSGEQIMGTPRNDNKYSCLVTPQCI
ncbi:hypothetical protein EDD21DRAFT_420237 [Dissophora ornata]|nr:hypothetical protein EDD21DRAFT_420237 [Dissophora ornata]